MAPFYASCDSFSFHAATRDDKEEKIRVCSTNLAQVAECLLSMRAAFKEE